MAGSLKGKWAVVTGASSGLGVDFARELASRGANVVLVARRKDRLEQVADELRSKHGAEVEVVALDLSSSDAPLELHRRMKDGGRDIEILVNNAGFGIFGLVLEIPFERVEQMLDLDIAALVHLSRLFGIDMVARGSGYVLQVASIGAYQASPTYASYAAAKSFVLHFGEAFDYELSGTGVSCTVLSPGMTETEFLDVSGQSPTWFQRLVMMPSSKVASIGIRAMLRRRRSIIPGVLNSVMAWFIRFMPRRFTHWVAWRTMKTPEIEQARTPSTRG